MICSGMGGNEEQARQIVRERYSQDNEHLQHAEHPLQYTLHSWANSMSTLRT